MASSSDYVQVINIEDPDTTRLKRDKQMRKRRSKSSSSGASSEVIIVGTSSVSTPVNDDVVILSDGEKEKSSRKNRNKTRILPVPLLAGTDEVFITKEEKPPAKKPKQRDMSSLAVNNPSHLPIEDDPEKVEAVQNSTDEDEDSDLPCCSFIEKNRNTRSTSTEGDISPLDLFDSFPVIGKPRVREEKYSKQGTPLYWTSCSKCSQRCTDSYHTILVAQGMEFDTITSSMKSDVFHVKAVHRVQNTLLWKRYKGEKSLMKEGTHEGYDVHETWLYHTTNADTAVICEEGLDPRLSRAGCFGRGTYFSDDPLKCHSYASGVFNGIYTMLLCRVLLGDIKVYPHRMKDVHLTREPPKTNPLPGEKKMYDSVKGNITGSDEYIVYNPYRVLPEYIIEYEVPGTRHYTGIKHVKKTRAKRGRVIQPLSRGFPLGLSSTPQPQPNSPPYPPPLGLNLQRYQPVPSYNPPNPTTQGYGPSGIQQSSALASAQGTSSSYPALQGSSYLSTQGRGLPNLGGNPSGIPPQPPHSSLPIGSLSKGQFVKLCQNIKKTVLDSLTKSQ